MGLWLKVLSFRLSTATGCFVESFFFLGGGGGGGGGGAVWVCVYAQVYWSQTRDEDAGNCENQTQSRMSCHS